MLVDICSLFFFTEIIFTNASVFQLKISKTSLDYKKFFFENYSNFINSV